MPRSTIREAKVTTTTDWRCPNMHQHIFTHAQLPVPCKDCRTVEVIHTEIAVPLNLNTIAHHGKFVVWDLGE